MNAPRETSPPIPNLSSTTKAWTAHAEYHAGVLRHLAGCGPRDPLDPRKFAFARGIPVVYPAEVHGLGDDDRAVIASLDAKVWSGMGVPLPDGRYLVILNPSQTRERAAVTIMEEIAHDHFRHEPTSLEKHASGFVKRKYNERSEREAYWTASAALLPRLVVADAVWRRSDLEALARKYGVSDDLVGFRLKTLRLWSETQRPRPEVQRAI